MKFIPKFTASIEEGKLVLLHRDEFIKYLKGFEGKRVQIEVDKFREVRSLEQNRRYFGALVRTMADEAGYTVAQMHSVLKADFKTEWVKHPVTKRMIEIVPSSTVDNKEEFNRRMAHAEQMANEMGIVISDNF